ncbi:hypothetical protein ECP030477715_3239 [Escherichia coli P0304777.15]|nr:hypothetical protein ECP030477715_3239 [Escherichia coli P0304777.15]
MGNLTLNNLQREYILEIYKVRGREQNEELNGIKKYYAVLK